MGELIVLQKMKYILSIFITLIISCVASANDLLPNTAKVLAYVYDYTQKKPSAKHYDKRLIKDRVMHIGVIGEGKVLTKDQSLTLFKALRANRKPGVSADCYMPHHGFVFYDKDNAIIGHIELCFQCGNSYSSVKSIPNGNTWDWKEIATLLKQLEIPMLKKNSEYTKLYTEFAKQNK